MARRTEFHENLRVGSYIRLVESVRKKYGKVGMVADNAGAITGKEMLDYMAGT